jgi:hypothetical protein
MLPVGRVRRLKRGSAAPPHLDMQQAARFLSYPGILLESWRSWHGLKGAALGSGSRIWVPGEGCVEQEADSSWVRGRLAGTEGNSSPQQPGHPSHCVAGAWAGRT